MTIERGPLRYRFSHAGSDVLLDIYNPTDAAVTLRGDESTVVDPEGERHPVQTVTIAPVSRARLRLPPEELRAQVQACSTLRIGLGTGFGLGAGSGVGVGVGTAVGGRRGMPVSGDPPLFWRWRCNSSIRLNLAFQGETEKLDHAWIPTRARQRRPIARRARPLRNACNAGNG